MELTYRSRGRYGGGYVSSPDGVVNLSLTFEQVHALHWFVDEDGIKVISPRALGVAPRTCKSLIEKGLVKLGKPETLLVLTKLGRDVMQAMLREGGRA